MRRGGRPAAGGAECAALAPAIRARGRAPRQDISHPPARAPRIHPRPKDAVRTPASNPPPPA
ncbi:hypothetical protein GCM10010277_39780 [Streptomyces longisporoflavus]|nr:hypothetical protein GCM10010277_39780 [Streptomyces longisporoflavus]